MEEIIEQFFATNWFWILPIINLLLYHVIIKPFANDEGEKLFKGFNCYGELIMFYIVLLLPFVLNTILFLVIAIVTLGDILGILYDKINSPRLGKPPKWL